MKISIITCTWNSEPYLQQCIESVACQDYPDIEHVFVDGGSTDGTLERIQALGPSVRWVTNVRGGISNAMNEGVRLATGDVIAHLHGDDYYADERAVSRAAEALERTGAGWVYGQCKTETDVGFRDGKTPPYSYRRLAVLGNFIPHPATFIRKPLFEQAGGFSTSLKCCMDYDLWLRLGRIEAPVVLDDFLAVFRMHDGSHSSTNECSCFEEDRQLRMSNLRDQPLSWRIHCWLLLQWTALQVRRRAQQAAAAARCVAPDAAATRR
ncbi:MAG TPA: glycosyltransferase family 2 protein [Burkholderiaceae bacterium]|nr:glycosyltransferase family 2 protein [Burkholderiaceae bacterium]